MKIAVVGCGGIGSYFAHHIDKLIDLKQIKACDFTFFDDDIVEKKNKLNTDIDNLENDKKSFNKKVEIFNKREEPLTIREQEVLTREMEASAKEKSTEVTIEEQKNREIELNNKESQINDKYNTLAQAVEEAKSKHNIKIWT